MTVANQQLNEKVLQLYNVFRKYELHEHMEGCPCCVYAEDKERVRSKPLQALTSDDLLRYSYKALTTWGTADDFRYFLPRLFELQADSPMNLCNPEILCGKLTYANWRQWNQEEQNAIEKYFRALWRYVLIQPIADEHSYAEDYICAIGQAIDDLNEYLEAWLNMGPTAVKHLRLFVEYNASALNQNQLASSFWKERQDQANQIVKWLKTDNVQEQLRYVSEQRFHTSTR